MRNQIVDNFHKIKYLLSLFESILMYRLKYFFHKLSLSAGITTLWLLFCGVSRSPKESKFGLQDLQPTNMLQSMPPLSEIPTSFYLLASTFIGSIVGGIFLVRYLQKRKIQRDLDQIAEDQAQLAVDSEFEARQVDDEDLSLIHI